MEAVCPFCRQVALIEQRAEGLRCTLCLNTGRSQWGPGWEQGAPQEDAPGTWAEPAQDAWAGPEPPYEPAHSHEPVHEPAHSHEPVHEQPYWLPLGKSPWGAALRSWILPGWGQGHVRGAASGWTWFGLTVLAVLVALFLVGLGADGLGTLVMVVWLIAQIRVAYTMAKDHNAHYGLASPRLGGLAVALVVLVGLVFLVVASAVFVLVSDLAPEDGPAGGAVLPDAGDFVPAASACQAVAARTWLQEFERETRLSATVQGTDEGAPLHVRLDYDEAQDYLLIADVLLGESLHAFGPRVHSITPDGATEYRDVGTPSFAVRFMAPGHEDPASDWFTTPLAALEPSCAQRGSEVYLLSFRGSDVHEEWVWSPDGSLLSARFQRASTGTDVEITLNEDWSIQPAPASATRGASVSYTVVAAEAGSVILRIEDDFHVPFDGFSIHLYSGDRFLAELGVANGWAAAGAAATWQDRGQKGILDAGDLLSLHHGGAEFYFYDEWSGSYFEEYVVEDGASQWIAPSEGEMLDRHYEWQFKGNSYTLDLQIPLPLLEFYESTDFTYRNGRHNYAAYVASQYDDEAIQVIADELVRLGHSEGMTEHERVSNVLAFVQGLEYTSDSVTTGYDEFPRYPVQTLAERGGDCEDTAILFAALLQAMGYGVVLLELPGHMAAGVLVDDSFRGVTYTWEGKRWAYAETTGSGWALGQLPDVYRSASAKVHSLQPQAVVIIDDASMVAQNGAVSFTIHFSNDGLAASRSGTATVYGFDATRTRYYDSDHCTFDRLEPGTTYTCDLVLRNDSRIATPVVRVQTQDGLWTERVV